MQPNGQKKKQYLCECECGNIKVVQAQSLRNGTSQSCGCLAKEVTSRIHKKQNELINDENICYGYTTNSNEKFYFDKEDLEKIKEFAWFEYNGYIATNNYKYSEYPKLLKMHRFVMNVTDSKISIDHINHNIKDNRKINLRRTTQSQNSMNHKIFSTNNSGVSGVYFSITENKWKSEIHLDGKKISLGTFFKFEDAVLKRKEAEEILYGQYSYENSINLGEKYEI